MSDLISRQAAIELIERMKPYHQNADDIAEMIANMPSAQPDNQIHLCDSCEYDYPECPCKQNDVIFGNGKGNDNICACNKYKPSAQPDMSEYSSKLWRNAYERGKRDAQSEEDCDTCKHGYFGDDQCNNCRVRYPSHYERRTDD